ncbi:MAG: cellulose synthase subunit BcsC [Firmicutes bacterium ADurb.Bin182]|nr:MAG: cellulose synthase subunit BcsC [Firmicutes bacterium ADurb.Bin182]
MGKQNLKVIAGKGKIIPFQQTGEFFLKRGTTNLDKNKLIDAMVNYRQALSLDPDNVECKLAIAEVLTEMNRYEESNRVLFTLFDSDKPRHSECYFGMGCNFVGMQDFEHARDSFERYAHLEPDGEFTSDVYDMLEILQDEELFNEMFPEEDRIAADAMALASEGKELLERDDFKGAIASLERVVSEYPGIHFVRNNLALAYFCVKDYEKAMQQVSIILAEDPANIQAHCNLAMFCNAMKDKEAVKRELSFILDQKTEDPDDLNRMSITLMELGEFKTAKSLLMKLFSMLPYDCGITHRLAMCCYELGEYKRATVYYDRLLKMDSLDSVARFYRGVCRAAAEGAPKRQGLLYNYQVPFEELLSRMHRINDCAHKPRAELLMLWQHDEEFRSLIRWGLNLPDINIKRAVLALTASFGDFEAEQVLRDFALQRAQPDELKREVFGMLKHMNAKEPYFGYLNGELVQSKVSLIHGLPEDLPKSYRDVLEICFRNMVGTNEEKCLHSAASIWEKFLKSMKDYPPLSGQQENAFAAALEYLALRECKKKAVKSIICAEYGVSLARFNSAMGKLLHALSAKSTK